MARTVRDPDSTCPKHKGLTALEIMYFVVLIFIYLGFCIFLTCVKGIVWNFGHQTSYQSEPVCYLSLETV